jgi:carbon storage regulator
VDLLELVHLVRLRHYQARSDGVTTGPTPGDKPCAARVTSWTRPARARHPGRYGGPVLVLGRRVGESIVISGEITVTVLEVRGEMVRVGIDAPRSVAVQRAELLKELEESNKASASPSEDAVASLSRQLGRRAQT